MKRGVLFEHDLADVFGLRGVAASHIPALVCPEGHEPLILGELLDELSRSLVKQMLSTNYALGGAEVRFLRKALGLTQQRLADLLGVDRVTVARWEGLEQELVPMPVSIALRTVLSASEKSPVSAPNIEAYREPPRPRPSHFELESPAPSAVAF